MNKITLIENCFGPDVEIDDESLFIHEYDNRNPDMISDLQDQLIDKLKSLKNIVTVGGQYPSKVVCENETVLSLVKDPKLTLTKSYKLVGDPDKVKLPESRINNIIENGGMCDVTIEGSEIKFMTV